MALLEVNNVYKIYGEGDSKVNALDGVSLSVEQGEFVSIVGASGSGKSTLLHVIAGVDPPSDGEVYLNGESVYKKNERQLALYRRRNVGLIYQFFNLIPILTVEENITLPLQMDKKTPDKAELDALLETLGLSERRTHLPSQLSGGQQQRTAIGRSLLAKPSVMLADEPTGNLDTKNSNEIIELLRLSNRKYNQTLIIITHDMQIASMADRCIEIKDGRIVGGGL